MDCGVRGKNSFTASSACAWNVSEAPSSSAFGSPFFCQTLKNTAYRHFGPESPRSLSWSAARSISLLHGFARFALGALHCDQHAPCGHTRTRRLGSSGCRLVWLGGLTRRTTAEHRRPPHPAVWHFDGIHEAGFGIPFHARPDVPRFEIRERPRDRVLRKTGEQGDFIDGPEMNGARFNFVPHSVEKNAAVRQLRRSSSVSRLGKPFEREQEACPVNRNQACTRELVNCPASGPLLWNPRVQERKRARPRRKH